MMACRRATRALLYALSFSSILAARFRVFLDLRVRARVLLAWTEERRSSAISSVHQYAALLGEGRTRDIEASHASVMVRRIHPTSSPWSVSPSSSRLPLAHNAPRIEEKKASSSSFFRAHRRDPHLAVRRRANTSLGVGVADMKMYRWSDNVSPSTTTPHSSTRCQAEGVAHVRSTMDPPRGLTQVFVAPVLTRHKLSPAAHASRAPPFGSCRGDPQVGDFALKSPAARTGLGMYLLIHSPISSSPLRNWARTSAGVRYILITTMSPQRTAT